MLLIQKKVLSKVFQTKDVIFFLQLKSDYFINPTLNKIYRYLDDYINKYGKVPDLKFFKNKLAGKLGSDNPIIAMLESLIDLEIEESEKELLDSLKETYKIKQIDNIIPKLIESAKEKDIDTLKKNALQLEYFLDYDDNKKPKDILDEVYTPAKIKLVEPFLPEMQKQGLMFAGLSIIGAGSGHGKSILTLQQLMYSYEQGENVCLLNFELGFDDVIQRMYSMTQQVSFKEVYGNKDPEIIKQINEWKNQYFNRDNKFYISDKPMNMDEVEKVIRAYHKMGVEVFGIDYLNIIDYPSSQEEWKSLSTFVKRLHRLTKELGIVIISPTQINMLDMKEKDNQLRVTARGSRELEFSSSVFLVIYQTKEEYEQKTARIFTIKARNAERKTYVVQTNFKYMKFEDTGLSL